MDQGWKKTRAGRIKKKILFVITFHANISSVLRNRKQKPDKAKADEEEKSRICPIFLTETLSKSERDKPKISRLLAVATVVPECSDQTCQ